jgi:mRNA-degrading endonuclease toxin of MazEF toxin-antitoxin module
MKPGKGYVPKNSDQVKSLDWRKRKAKYITRVSKKIMDNVIEKILLLIH